MTLAEAKERIGRLERVVGEHPGGDFEDLVVQSVEHNERILNLQQCHTDLLKDLEDRFNNQRCGHAEIIDRLVQRMETMADEIAVLRKALSNHGSSEKSQKSKIKVPEPKQFNGSRNAKELENFLWDMEQYFRAARIPPEEQVGITSMYLSGDAKLWWRTRMADDLSAGRPKICTWEALKKELKDQFLPCNTSWIARENLKKLRQTGSVREYVKEFSSLMLDIQNMSEEDKLFNFMSGLQTWAQAELRRQGVKDIPTAMAAAEGLVDFRVSNPTPTADKRKSKEGKKGKNRDWERRADGKEKIEGESSMRKDQPNQAKSQWGCFICGGPHRARECPKKERINAIISQDSDEDEGSDSVPFRVNPLQLINTMTAESLKGLMYVKARVNGREIRAMLDTGATNNFVSKREVDRLGLRVSGSTCRIKAVNSEATPVCGVAETSLRLGAWQGSCRLTVVPLDDFDLILGVEFLENAKVTLMPHLRGILIGDEKCPAFVQTERGFPKNGKRSMVSAMGARSGKEMYAAALVQSKQDVVKVPDEVRATVREIMLEPGAEPVAKAPYRKALWEKAESRRPLDELLEARVLQPSKPPHGVPGLFQEEQIEFRSNVAAAYPDERELCSTSSSEHVTHGQQVFSRLREHHLFGRKEKDRNRLNKWSLGQLSIKSEARATWVRGATLKQLEVLIKPYHGQVMNPVQQLQTNLPTRASSGLGGGGLSQGQI